MVKEAKQARNDVELILDGAATRWAKELSKPDGHPSLATRVAEGRQVVTF